MRCCFRYEPLPDLDLRLVARLSWTVVPAALAGTAEAWPVGCRLWRPFGEVRVTFDTPITDPDEHALPGRLLAFWEQRGESGEQPRHGGRA